MYKITFVGGAYTFQTELIQKEIGCRSADSIIAFRNTFLFISEGGFYQGLEAKPIGHERVNRFMFRNVDSEYVNQIQGAADVSAKIGWWSIRKTNGEFVMLGYSFLLDRWCLANMDADYIVSGATPGYTIDSIDSFGSIDDLPFSLDSGFWKGGDIALAGFGSSGNFGFFQGDPIEAKIETNDIALTPGRRSFVKDIRLVSDLPDTTYTAQVAGRDHPGAQLEWTAPITPNHNSGRCLARKRGRTSRARIIIPEGQQWTNLNAVEFIYNPAGDR